MSFHVGQKVACVDAAPYGVWLCGEELVKGAIYTIRAIGPSFGEMAVQLEEVTRITDSIFSRPGVWGYVVRRFRPLTDTKTSTMAWRPEMVDANDDPKDIEARWVESGRGYCGAFGGGAFGGKS